MGAICKRKGTVLILRILKWAIVAVISLLLVTASALLIYQLKSRSKNYAYSLGCIEYSKEIVFTKGDKKIVLIGMIHIGESDFYEELKSQYDKDEYLVLAEGITNRTNIVTPKIDYGDIAGWLGLVSQKRLFSRNVINADVDLADIDPSKLIIINQVFEFIELVQNEGLFNISEETAASKYVFDKDGVKDETIFKRNDHLFRVIQAQLSGSKPLIVPWGAGHLPDIEKRIKCLGFREDSSRSRRVMNLCGFVRPIAAYLYRESQRYKKAQ